MAAFSIASAIPEYREHVFVELDRLIREENEHRQEFEIRLAAEEARRRADQLAANIRVRMKKRASKSLTAEERRMIYLLRNRRYDLYAAEFSK